MGIRDRRAAARAGCRPIDEGSKGAERRSERQAGQPKIGSALNSLLDLNFVVDRFENALDCLCNRNAVFLRAVTEPE